MRLAAVSYASGQGAQVDAILSEVARTLAARGFRLAGSLRANVGAVARGVVFEDLASGRRIHAVELLSSSAVDSRLDSSALEEAAGLAIASLGIDTDLVIVNRFGRQEADGHGFRPLIELAAVMNVPVLAGLNHALIPEWATFTRGLAMLVEPELDAVLGWCNGELASRARRHDDTGR